MSVFERPVEFPVYIYEAGGVNLLDANYSSNPLGPFLDSNFSFSREPFINVVIGPPVRKVYQPFVNEFIGALNKWVTPRVLSRNQFPRSFGYFRANAFGHLFKDESEEIVVDAVRNPRKVHVLQILPEDRQNFLQVYNKKRGMWVGEYHFKANQVNTPREFDDALQEVDFPSAFEIAYRNEDRLYSLILQLRLSREDAIRSQTIRRLPIQENYPGEREYIKRLMFEDYHNALELRKTRRLEYE